MFKMLYYSLYLISTEHDLFFQIVVSKFSKDGTFVVGPGRHSLATPMSLVVQTTNPPRPVS